MRIRNIKNMLPAMALGLLLVSPDVCAAPDGGRVWTAKRPTSRLARLNTISKERVAQIRVTPMATTRAMAPEADNMEVVLGEDFSKFTAGSEENPDMTNILTSEGVIMQDYISTYGWSGINIYQAGGCCFLADGVEALLMTPVIDLSADNGNFVVNFSYRSKSGDTKVYVVGQIEGASQGFGGYLPCTEEWKSVSVSFEGNGAAKTALQFFGDAPVFIDDIEVCQTGGSVVEPEPISAPVALSASDITSTGFTANWEPVQGASAYLLDVFYFVDNQPQYVEKDFETTETSKTLTGLEPGRLYYYSVQATDGTDVSAESAIISAKEPVESLEAPVAAAATEVSNDGFRANWSAVEGATYYEVVTLSDYKIPESGTFVLDDETFDKVTTGTVSSPVYNDVQCNLNKYTNYPDWYGTTTLLAEGMIGLKNYYALMGAYSMLYSPIYQNDAANPGAVKVRIAAKMVDCTVGTKLGVALVDPITGEVIGDKWNFVELSEDMKDYDFDLPASNSFYLAVGFDDSNDIYGTTGMVFIDAVKITQEMAAGTTLTRIYKDDIAYNNSLYVDTPDKREGEKYSYYVVAAGNGSEGEVVSDASEFIDVDGSASVSGVVTAQGVNISVGRGEVKVTTDTQLDVNVFDMSGRTVARIAAVKGTAAFALAPGAYIVKCGSEVRKIIVR